MLPRLAGHDGEHGEERRPSLPSIRDLFGEHLAQPINKPSPFILPPSRSSSFSLADLGSSLPTNSRPTSPAESQGSLFSSLTSPRSAWSQVSGYPDPAHGWPEPYSARRHSDAGPLLTTPSTSSSHEQFVTLPPIKQPYTYSRGREHPASTSYLTRTTSSSRRAFETHVRSRSSSEAIVAKESRASQAALEASFKRRHTIGSSRGPSPMRFQYPTEPMPQSSAHTSSAPSIAIVPTQAPRTSVTNPYPSASTHPSLTRGLPLVVDSSRVPSCPPSPSSTTSGDSAPTERRKSVAKYECQYCGKRFNRPSSLKIHHNTHTGEKPFACPFPGCGRHFSVMSNMRRHARIHGEPSSQKPHEGSAEEIFDVPTSAYSSSSSSHNTPIIPQATMPSAYSRSHPSSASPSPHLHAISHLPSSSRPESRRRSIVSRTHPYRRSRSPSTGGGSSPER